MNKPQAATEKSVSTPASGALGFKDIIAAVPIVGTAAAISYDVGFFSGLDSAYFTFFSFAEHLLFALEVLPLVLLVAFIGTLALAWAMMRKELHAVSGKRSWLENKWAFYLSAAAFPIGAFVLLHYGYEFLAGAIMFVFLGCLVWLDGGPAASNAIIWISYGASGLLITSYYLGMDQGSYSKTLGASQNIELVADGTTVKARVLRSGDKGVLLFEPNSSKLTLMRWNTIKSISAIEPAIP
jgi:NADH:ubiquinone oxidoreductase subunit 6 (subunit J)